MGALSALTSSLNWTVEDGIVLKNAVEGDVPPNLLKRLLEDADFNRWERLILLKTLDSMDAAAYCPRCETVCLKDEKNNDQCSKCFYSFCTHCRLRCHIGERCMGITPEEKLLSLQEREKVRQLSKGDIEKAIFWQKKYAASRKLLLSFVLNALTVALASHECQAATRCFGGIVASCFAMAVGRWAAMAVRQGEMFGVLARTLFMDEISTGLDSSTTYHWIGC